MNEPDPVKNFFIKTATAVVFILFLVLICAIFYKIIDWILSL